jgi:hypothetical protein
MTVADVARVLKLGTDRVRQLDDRLRPVRLDSDDGPRRYAPADVERVMRERERSRR